MEEDLAPVSFVCAQSARNNNVITLDILCNHYHEGVKVVFNAAFMILAKFAALRSSWGLGKPTTVAFKACFVQSPPLIFLWKPAITFKICMDLGHFSDCSFVFH